MQFLLFIVFVFYFQEDDFVSDLDLNKLKEVQNKFYFLSFGSVVNKNRFNIQNILTSKPIFI
ncbi:hypothetical protein ACSO1_14490 [Acinetobacter calcoaceticus]|nr:hypothetical protein ACSO1_14490 [Acinetobacter calcoaceticus]